jgi:prepilin-type N-terminal cleavage/methylation domain-containing protein
MGFSGRLPQDFGLLQMLICYRGRGVKLERGFTLLELLIAMSIIVVLSTMVLL